MYPYHKAGIGAGTGCPWAPGAECFTKTKTEPGAGLSSMARLSGMEELEFLADPKRG